MSRVFIASNGSRITRAERNSGGQWSIETLLEGANIRCLSADPRNRNIVYAGTKDRGVLRSEDMGKTWQSAGMEGRDVKSIAVSPAEPGLIFAGTKPPAMYVSRDGGQRWTELSAFQKERRWWWFTPAEMPPNQPYIQGIALSPTDPNVIIAGVECGAVLRSEDGGKTWQNHRRGALRDCHSVTFHASSGEWVYEGGGTGAGAAFSRDAGNTWTQIKQGLDRHYGWAVAADPARPDRWYVSLSPGPMKAHSAGNAQAYIFRSVGGSWEKLGCGLPQPLSHMPYALLTDRDAPGHLYAGLSNGDIWHTTDYGDHWQQLPLNLGKLWSAVML